MARFCLVWLAASLAVYASPMKPESKPCLTTSPVTACLSESETQLSAPPLPMEWNVVETESRAPKTALHVEQPNVAASGEPFDVTIPEPSTGLVLLTAAGLIGIFRRILRPV